MGRPRSGYITTQQAYKLEIKDLIKAGAIIKGERVKGKLSIGKAIQMRFISDLTNEYPTIRLTYQVVDDDNHKRNYDYFIYLSKTASNLGRGEILHFICPVSGERTKTLYMAYGSPTWKHRDAYLFPIYYPSQTFSQLNYHNYRYLELTKREKNKKDFRTKTYMGMPTKNSLKEQRLSDKIEFHEEQISLYVPLAIQKLINEVCLNKVTL